MIKWACAKFCEEVNDNSDDDVNIDVNINIDIDVDVDMNKYGQPVVQNFAP